MTTMSLPRSCVSSWVGSSNKPYRVLGQEVRTLVDGFQEMGVQAVVWGGRDGSGQEVSSGVYFYRLEVAGKYVEGRRMLLAK